MRKTRFVRSGAVLISSICAAIAACVGDPPLAPIDGGASTDSGTSDVSAGGDAGSGFCATQAASGAQVLACSDFDEGPPAAAGWTSIELTGGATANLSPANPFSPPDALAVLVPKSPTPVAGALYLAQQESSNTFDAKLHFQVSVGAGCVLADAGASNLDASLVLGRFDFYAGGDVAYRIDILAAPPSASPSKLSLALATYVASDAGLSASGNMQETDAITPQQYFAVDFEFHTGGGSPTGKLNGQTAAFPVALIGGKPFVAVGLLGSHTSTTCEVDVDDVALTSL